jgi:AraC-like DNA-binding protein
MGIVVSELEGAPLLAPAANSAPEIEGTYIHSEPAVDSVHRWSTAQIDPNDRFDYWREVRAKGLFGATVELEPEQRPRFFGEFSLRKIGAAGLIRLRASPYRVERSPADIADSPSNSLCIYQQLGGGGRFRTGDAGEFAIACGKFATGYSDLPYHAVPITAEGFDLRVLKVPMADISAPKTNLHDLVPKPFGDHAALAPLLESCFCDLTEAAEDRDPPTTIALVRTLVQLALIERGVVAPRGRAAQHAVRAGRLSLGRRLIAHNIAQPQLSPSLVADLLGISVRHMHVLFEPTNASFSQTVTALRVDQSCRQLRKTPSRSIAEIAFACGFDSLATFYRAFRAIHGITPGDFRALRARPDGA